MTAERWWVVMAMQEWSQVGLVFNARAEAEAWSEGRYPIAEIQPAGVSAAPSIPGDTP